MNMNEQVSPISEYPKGSAPLSRWVYFTDPHGTARTPSSRTDNFLETFYKKLAEVIQAAHDVEADGILCGGDFANSPWLSIAFADEVGDFLREHLKDMPFYFVSGNHDVEAYNPGSFRTTAIGLMIKTLPTGKILHRGEPIRVTNKRGNTTILSGVPSYAMLDRDIETDEGIVSRTRDYVINEPADVPIIHIVHGMLLTKPLVEDAPFTLVQDILDTHATVTLTGHDHTGFAPVRTNHDGIVWNPGAALRVFASEQEMLRIPKYGIVDIHGQYDPKIYVQEFKVARPGSEILDRSKLDAEKERKELMSKMENDIKSVLQTASVESVRVSDLMTLYKKELPVDVYNELERRINDAKVALKIEEN